MATNENSTTADTSMIPSSTRPRRLPNARMVQNFLLVWLDESIDEINNEDCRDSIDKLRQVVNNVNTFTDADNCIDFISGIKKEKTFLIFSGTLGQTTVPIVHDKPQVITIYIFCDNKTRHEKWVQGWPKIKDVFTDIIPICEALKKAVQDCDHNSVSISLVKTTDGVSDENLNGLDQSFMYMQILKEILLTIDFKKEGIHEFLMYCREQFSGNTVELENIDKLEKEYRRHQPIWWYTYDCFLYSMLNCALRTMEVDLIIKMEFFLRDLHKHIAVLHSKQYAGQNRSNRFIVYRGQGLSQANFEEVVKTKGGLLAFNNFLSTNKIRDVPLDFARQTMATSDLIGVLFVMIIDPSISSTPFADIRDVRASQTEEEILFSMHSVFRIEQIKQIDKNDRLWQVDLTLIGNSDPQQHALTERIREETKGSTGWLRLGKLMIKLGEFNNTENLYDILLAQTNDDNEKGDIFYGLGCIKFNKAEYTKSIAFYENSLKIRRTTFTSQHPDVAECYNDIGIVYNRIGEYSKARSYHEKALEIYQKTLPENHPDLATSYNNIGKVHDSMGEYSKALSYYEKALEIFQKTLPARHPHLASSYNNIGGVYNNMGEYPKALSYYEKALEIQQKTLSPNHPDLATSYNDVGLVYKKIGEYSKALSYYEKALEIFQKTLPANHPSSATSYNNIGSVYYNMGEYSKALSYYEKALEIRQKTLPANHPSWATSYNNIGTVYYNMGEYSTALSYYEKDLEISQKTLLANHPDLATSYNNIGNVYNNMDEYSEALSYYEKALEIRQNTLAATHPDLASSYNNIGGLYNNMGEYSKALSYYEKALEIYQKPLPANHPDLATSFACHGSVYNKMSEYSKALSYYEKALEIYRKTLPENHTHFATSYNNVGQVYHNMREYSKALSYYEKALEIFQKTLPANHPHLATSYNNIGNAYYDMREYSKALSSYERALDIRQRSLRPDHPHIQIVKENIEIVKKKY